MSNKLQIPIADLKLEVTYLTQPQIHTLIQDSIQDGFTVLALNRTINPKTDYKPDNIDLSPYKAQNVKILNRITIKLNSITDIDSLKSKKTNYEQADLVAVEFSDIETFEVFVKKYNDYIDNLIYINIGSFAVSSTFLKLLKNKNWFIELDYSKLLNETKKKQALVSFYKLLDSHYDKLLLSSDANSVFDRRSEWEIKEIIHGLMERSDNYSAKLAKELLSTNPLALLKRCLLRKQGFAYFENN